MKKKKKERKQNRFGNREANPVSFSSTEMKGVVVSQPSKESSVSHDCLVLS